MSILNQTNASMFTSSMEYSHQSNHDKLERNEMDHFYRNNDDLNMSQSSVGITDMELEYNKLSRGISSISFNNNINNIKSIEPVPNIIKCIKFTKNKVNKSSFVQQKKKQNMSRLTKIMHSTINYHHQTLSMPSNKFSSFLNVIIKKKSKFDRVNRCQTNYYRNLQKSFPCNICSNKTFNNWHELKQHIHSKHLSEMPDISI